MGGHKITHICRMYIEHTARTGERSCRFLRFIAGICVDPFVALLALPIAAGGEAEMALKDLCEVTLMGEAACPGDVGKGNIRLFEQALCLFDALAQYELMWAFPRG
jgi:hypothetical protein